MKEDCGYCRDFPVTETLVWMDVTHGEEIDRGERCYMCRHCGHEKVVVLT